MNEIFMDKNEFAACLIISAVLVPVISTRAGTGR